MQPTLTSIFRPGRNGWPGAGRGVPRRASWVAGVLALAVAALAGSPVCVAAATLNVVTEEWAPYNYAENGSLKGMSVEIVQALARSLQVEVDFRLLPSMRAKAALESEPRTLMISMLRTPEREDRYKWIGPLGESSIYFYKRRGSPLVIATLEDAKRVPLICTRHAGLAVARLRREGFTNLSASAVEGRSVYQMLLLGRCDLAVSDSLLGVSHALKQIGQPPDAVVQTPVKVLTLPLYIAASKDMPDVEVARWQAALDALKKSGALQAIVKKYE